MYIGNNELDKYVEFYEKNNKLKDQIKDKYSYYYADELNTKILSNDLIYLDIKSAFPTICNIIFKSDENFINELNSKENKLEKNIFIATHLKSEELTTLNYLCKVLILNYTYINYETINIIEYVKDGIIIDGYQKNSFDFENILFRTEKIDYYLRFNKTSFYCKDNKLDIKGFFKEPPKYISETILNLIFKNKDYYNKEFYNLKIIYSKLFLKILKLNKMFGLIKEYYMFNNKYFINQEGKRTTDIEDFSPEYILKFFIYPILYLFRVFEK